MAVYDPFHDEWVKLDYRGAAPFIKEYRTARCGVCPSYEPETICHIWRFPNGSELPLCVGHVPRGEIKKLLKEAGLNHLVWRAMEEKDQQRRKSSLEGQKALQSNRYT